MRKQKKKPQPTDQSWSARGLWPIFALAMAVAAVYYNSLQNDFVFDDLETIVELQSPGGAGPFGQLDALLRGHAAYRPVRSASYAVDYAISGLDPLGYHLSNIALHALSAIFVFLIARALFQRVGPACLAALLFAVHPIQTDAVTYLSGRRDVLSGLLVLAGVYTFVRYRRTGKVGDLAATALLFPLAFFTKESGIILPLLCAGYDVGSRIRARDQGSDPSIPAIIRAATTAAFRENRWVYLPAAMAASGLAAYVLFVVRGTWQQSYHGGSFGMTILTMARVFLHYITLLLFPLTLNADYSYNAFPVTTSWTDPWALTALVILMALGYGLLRCVKTRPLVALGGAWFFIALLPVSQIVPHHEMMAEHYLYVPSVGFCLLVVGLIEPYLERPGWSPACYTAAGLVLMLLSFRTVLRNTDWKDDVTLWSRTVQVAPQAARARNNLGAAYLRRGQLGPAQEQLEAALQVKPEFAVAHGNLWKVYLDRADLGRAEAELRTALTLKPDDTIPRLWLGAVYMRKGQMAEAEPLFRAAMRHPQSAAYAYNNLGVLFAKRGQSEEAEAAFREALRRMPQLTEARDNLIRLARVRDRAGQVSGLGQGGEP